MRPQHARPRWQLDQHLARRRRADRVWDVFGGWCLGVFTLAAVELLARALA